MPLLWTPRTIPELAAVQKLPPARRQEVWGRCWRQIRRHWQFWVGCLAAVAVAVGVYALLSPLLADAGIPVGVFNGLIAGAAGGFAGGILVAQVVNRLAVPYLRADLAGPASTDGGT